jgi:hypothetical protein
MQKGYDGRFDIDCDIFEFEYRIQGDITIGMDDARSENVHADRQRRPPVGFDVLRKTWNRKR